MDVQFYSICFNIDALTAETRELKESLNREDSYGTRKWIEDDSAIGKYVAGLRSKLGLNDAECEIWALGALKGYNFHFDCDESKRIDGCIVHPLLSTVTYLSDSPRSPTVITDVDTEQLKYKEFGEGNKLCISPFRKGTFVAFCPKYYHSGYREEDTERLLLAVNFWKKCPDSVPVMAIRTNASSYSDPVFMESVNPSVEYNKCVSFNNLSKIFCHEGSSEIESLYSCTVPKIFTGDKKLMWKSQEEERLKRSGSAFIDSFAELSTNKITHANRFLQRSVTRDFISKSQCDIIVRSAEEYGSKHGWTKMRHQNYPTTDIPLQCLPREIQSIVLSRGVDILEPFMELYQLPVDTKLNVLESFVVKYTPSEGGQTCLGMHHDQTPLSFQISLSAENDYEGGGTEYCDGIVLRPPKGAIIHQSGFVHHAGRSITRGTRYVLVGFVELRLV